MTKIDFIFLLLVAQILGEDKITLSEKDIFDLMNSELNKSEEEIDISRLILNIGNRI